jgi:lysophospholipase L1-like esterase
VSQIRRLPPAALSALALASLLASGPSLAQTRYVAFGDSITEGTGDEDSRPAGERGYPARLEDLLVAAGQDAVVENFGLGGERTPEGLTRLDEVLEGGGDVLLLMEGSNDISRSISIETTRENLAAMARRAEGRGLSVVHATLIPRVPQAARDAENLLNQRLNEEIRHLAGVQGRELADNFEVFGELPDLFAELYWQQETDRVGHPNAQGYDVMADLFFDVLVGNDNVPPVTGPQAPRPGSRGISPTSNVSIEIWDFGSGIVLEQTGLRIDGEEVPTEVEGDSRQARLVYRPTVPFSGIVEVGLISRDVAGNAVDRTVSEFVIEGTTFLAGDLDRDGRVDGVDLVRLAQAFGAVRGGGRFDARADLDGDDDVDGEDLALLAANFGRSSV